MPNLELPTPPVGWEHAAPKRLLYYDAPLGHISSSPYKLALHTVLAARPHRIRTVASITTELVEAATPAVALDRRAINSLRHRTKNLLDRSPWTGRSYVRTNQETTKVGYGHNAYGRACVPILAIIAAHWLIDRETTQRLLPFSATQPKYHGLRLACLQYGLRGANFHEVAEQLGLADENIRKTYLQLEREGLVSYTGLRTRVYMTSTSVRPDVEGVISELHGLRQQSYAFKLQDRIIPQIVRDATLYGRLAHAALKEVPSTRRVVDDIQSDGCG